MVLSFWYARAVTYQRWACVAAFTTTACATPEKAARPHEVDDVAPYELAADCSDLPRWGIIHRPARVHGVGPDEAWVVTEGAGYPTLGGRLLHLRSDGTVVPSGHEGIHDVWLCGDTVWAVGTGGLILRRGADETAFSEIALPYNGELLGGFGCDGDLWIPGGDVVFRHDGSGFVAYPIEPHEFLGATLMRVYGAGRERIASQNYGGVYYWDEPTETFLIGDGTDDVLSDVFVRRDGTGYTLHLGYALVMDKKRGGHQVVDDLTPYRVHRRSDDDVWYAGAPVTHVSSTRRIHYPEVRTNDDVHASARAVWIVGFYGAAVLTQEGFCPVVECSDDGFGC